MFDFQGTSPKEGRTRRGIPGLPNPGSPRSFRSRQRALLLLVLVTLVAWFYLLDSRSPASEDWTLLPREREHPHVDSHDDLALPASSHQVPLGATEEGDAVKENPAKEKPPKLALTKGSSSLKSSPYRSSSSSSLSSSSSPSSDKHGSPSQTSWEAAKDLDTALQRLVRSLPGEMHLRDILRPITGKGREKLRELVLRVRAFKDFFQTWENVHLFQDSQGNAFVREDVVQYIRGTAKKQVTHNDDDDDDNADDDDDDDDASTQSFISMVHAYEQYRSFISQFTKMLFPFYAPFYPDLLGLKSSFARGGRGIVLTAGDHQAPFIITTIASFRKLGCDLPIEVMYLGLSDLSDDFRADLEAIPGVITRDISSMVNDEGWKLAGWAAKPFAMLLSSFREVMFIDADSAFFRNPEELFDDPNYKRTGALFFKDRKVLPEEKKRWLQQILPQPISRAVRQSRMWTGESGHMQESGVVVVDKWKHFVAMLFVTVLNGPERDAAEGTAGIYEMMYGDKETFWLGWEMVGDKGYSWHPGDAGTMGVVLPQPQNDSSSESSRESDPESSPEYSLKNVTICAPQLLHLDTDGKPLWFNGWLLESKFAEEKAKKFAVFKDYVIEPPGVREPTPWQLSGENVCCLTTDPELRRPLSPQDTAFLDWLKQKAIDVGART